MKAQKEKEKRVRIVLDLSTEAAERLDLMKNFAIGETRSSVIRLALQLFESCVEDAQKGNKFFVGPTLEDASEVRLIGLN